MDELKEFYFTFGHGYPDKVQVIYAKSSSDARSVMFKSHGWQWAFEYTAEEWAQAKRKGHFDNVQFLQPLTDEEDNK